MRFSSLAASAFITAASSLAAQGVSPDGAVLHWGVAGPFEEPGTPMEFLLNAEVGLENPDSVIEWTPVQLEGRLDLDLGELLGDPMNCVAFLRTEVFAPDPTEVRFELGSDDGVRLWVNGEHLYANAAARATRCREDLAGTTTLGAGWNDVVLKISQGLGGFGACLHIVGPDGEPVPGLQARAPELFVDDLVDSGPPILPPPPVWASERWTGDPHSGDWVGWMTIGDEGEEQRRMRLAGQMIAHGDDLFRFRLLEQFDTRDAPIDILAGSWNEDEGGPLELVGGEWRATSNGGVITGYSVGMTSKQFQLSRVVRPSPTLGAPPPEDAIVLFDGDDFDEWQGSGGGPVTWTLVDGAMQVTPKTNSLETKRTFTDMHLHLEFRSPYSPGNPHQFYGNSGVFFPGGHEVQVLSSYGSEGMKNECGGIYFVAPPLVNMCRAPLEWQTYDVVFFAETDESPARITVRHNGILIHDDLELPRNGQREGRFWLQDHHNQVQYRNIWVAAPES